MAYIRGNADHPNLYGEVYFYKAPWGGVIVNAEICGLPDMGSTSPDTYHRNQSVLFSHFYGMHIHENGNCTPPFDQTGNHYNPEQLPHPAHAGDLPPLLGNNGYAWMAFYDNRISIEDILGRSLVIHDMRDDFTTQPSGGSGTKIGCGVIEPYQ